VQKHKNEKGQRRLDLYREGGKSVILRGGPLFKKRVRERGLCMTKSAR